MKSLLMMFLVPCISLTAYSQNNAVKDTNKKSKIHVGGNCEGCEAIHESLVPFEKLNNVDTLPGFNEPGPKIEIRGIVYELDGNLKILSKKII